jgi:hypothetical protein
MAKKTFNQKLNDSKDMPKLEQVSLEMAVKFGGQNMLIASPLDYDCIMKAIPSGKLTTTDRIRKHLASKHNADFTCPLTAGIFINIAANASHERQGILETPYWRTLKKDGELCEKYPGGLQGHRLLLQAEGHKIVDKGKRSFVQDYNKFLFDL